MFRVLKYCIDSVGFTQLVYSIHCTQWRIYIEAKEAVLEAPRLKGSPKFVKK